MGMILTPQQWTQQPQSPARINPAWAARGFDFAWSASDPARGGAQILTQDFGGVSRTTIAAGQALAFTGGTQTGKFTGNVPDSATNTFVIVGSSSNNAATSGRPVSCFNGTGGADIYINQTTNLITSQEFFTTTNGQYAAGSFNANTAQPWVAVIVQYGVAGTLPLIVINGVNQSLTTVTGGVGTRRTSSGQIAVGGRPDVTTRQYYGNLAFAAHSNQALSLAEAQLLSASLAAPWQIFAPLPRRIWARAPAGGGGPTNYTKSLAGSLTVSGGPLRRTSKKFTGSITGSGTLQRRLVILRAVSGSITSSGSRVKRAGKRLAGSITTTGTIRKAVSRRLVGSITGVGSLTKRTARRLAGSITGSGTVLRSFVTRKALAGSVLASGALATLKQTFTASAAASQTISHMRRFIGRR